MSDASVFVETVPDLRAAARMLGMEHAADEDRPSSKAGVEINCN
jgi:hypothetical protein